MKKLSFKILILVLISFSFNLSFFSQESINSSGTDIIGTGGNLSYSVGQIFYNSHESTSGTVNSGVQQTYEITNVGLSSNVDQTNFSVFPNPVSENLTISSLNFTKSIRYNLYDSQGGLINNGNLFSNETIVNTSNLSSGTYYLNLYNKENNKTQSFKIIKNK
jgi:hypothetical protein